MSFKLWPNLLTLCDKCYFAKQSILSPILTHWSRQKRLSLLLLRWGFSFIEGLTGFVYISWKWKYWSGLDSKSDGSQTQFRIDFVLHRVKLWFELFWQTLFSIFSCPHKLIYCFRSSCFPLRNHLQNLLKSTLSPPKVMLRIQLLRSCFQSWKCLLGSLQEVFNLNAQVPQNLIARFKTKIAFRRNFKRYICFIVLLLIIRRYLLDLSKIKLWFRKRFNQLMSRAEILEDDLFAQRKYARLQT